MRIERIQDEDVPEVAALLRACFDWLSDQEGFDPCQQAFLIGERSSERTIREEARTRPHWVARKDGVVAGFIVINANRIERLYVHPRFHRQGIGRALFATAEYIIRQAGFAEITVGALVDGAVTFYQSMGMTVTGSVTWEPDIFVGRTITLLSKRLTRE